MVGKLFGVSLIMYVNVLWYLMLVVLVGVVFWLVCF